METIDEELYYINSIEFSEYIDNMKVKLRKEDLEYNNMLKEISKIKEKYTNIGAILENDDVTELTKEECEILKKIVLLYYDISDKQEKQIFFLGGKHAYLYFKKIGIIIE